MLTIEISPGEAIDRVMILNLKRKALPDNKVIEEEWLQLSLKLAVYRRDNNPQQFAAEITFCWNELELTHARLWDLETEKRQFGGEMPTKAHAIYVMASLSMKITELNDRRSELKKLFNEYYGALQTEVKVFKKKG